MRIEIKPVSLSNQRIIEDRGCYIELHENHIVYTMRFLADEPINNDDKDLGWEAVENDFIIIALKNNIVGCERIICVKPKRWRVEIHVNGFAQDLRVYFKTKEESDDFHADIIKYILK